MGRNLDLNRLRDTIRENQRRGETRPDLPSQRILVDREGKVRFGDEVTESARELSEVPQQTFGGILDSLFGSSTASADRLARDREVAKRKLPFDTREAVQGCVTTFVYSVTDEFGQRYQLAAYFDGDEYMVKLVYPPLEGEIGVETGHVFHDGTLCLREPFGGMPTLEAAYARSVVLVNGLSVVRRGGQFPF